MAPNQSVTLGSTTINASRVIKDHQDDEGGGKLSSSNMKKRSSYINNNSVMFRTHRHKPLIQRIALDSPTVNMPASNSSSSSSLELVQSKWFSSLSRITRLSWPMPACERTIQRIHHHPHPHHRHHHHHHVSSNSHSVGCPSFSSNHCSFQWPFIPLLTACCSSSSTTLHHSRSRSAMSHFSSLLLIFLRFLLLSSIISIYSVSCDRNRFYHISALCLRERVIPLYKMIDGAVITSKSESNLDCTITFQTDTVLQKFMLRFEKLALDCNDHLYIYDGAHTIGNHKAHLSCRSTRAEVGTIYTQDNFLTLHYTTDAYSKPDNGFRLIITAYKDSKNHCREHRCANQFCIARDLVCDGVNHCGDNSDESYSANCQDPEQSDTIIGLEPTMFIAIVGSVFLTCLTCVISVSWCLCRREKLIQRQQQRIAMQQSQQYTAHQLMDTGLMMHHTGGTPILAHNNSYNSKLDGCTMITSLDYGATRNGGLVNSFTHTTLPNHQVNGVNFATLPHLHHQQQQHNHLVPPGCLMGNGGTGLLTSTGSVQANQAQQQQQQQQQHVRFGTLPSRGSEKPPPPYPGNYFNGSGTGGGNVSVLGPANGSIPGQATNGGILTNGNGSVSFANHTPPNSSSSSSQQTMQTQVIYTAK